MLVKLKEFFLDMILLSPSTKTITVRRLLIFLTHLKRKKKEKEDVGLSSWIVVGLFCLEGEDRDNWVHTFSARHITEHSI